MFWGCFSATVTTVLHKMEGIMNTIRILQNNLEPSARWWSLELHTIMAICKLQAATVFQDIIMLHFT